jgi:hypothetical protein
MVPLWLSHIWSDSVNLRNLATYDNLAREDAKLYLWDITQHTQSS